MKKTKYKALELGGDLLFGHSADYLLSDAFWSCLNIFQKWSASV